jgi:hypothetical protein
MFRFRATRAAIFLWIAFLSLSLLPSRAYADGVTFTGPTDITLTETGTGRPVFLYTLTNNSNITLQGISPLPSAVPSGDSSDVPPFSYGSGVGRIGECVTGGSLGIGDSCTMELVVYLDSLDNGASETDADSGIWNAALYVNFSNAPSVSTNVKITVNDPVPAPEPSSLLLISSGFLGVWILQRKLRPA